MIYGYARVSSKEQNEDRQIIALREYNIPDEAIFIDHQSGKDFNRPQYQKLMKILKQNDIFVTKSIDRLGRNYDEILEQWRILTKERHVSIIIIDMPLLDTRSERDLTGRLMADIFLQFLSYIAEIERNFIRQRQAEGIMAAKRRGVTWGPSPMSPPDKFFTIYEKWKNGAISARKSGKALGVSCNTFLKWARNMKN